MLRISGWRVLERLWKTCYVKGLKRPISVDMRGIRRLQRCFYEADVTIRPTLGMLVLGVLLVMGCERGNTITIQITDYRAINPTHFSRIEIPQEHLATGLRELLKKMSEEMGPIEVEMIVQNYSQIVQEGLQRSGYCSIQKLNINGMTVDIDAYFRTKDTQPVLIIEAYLQGGVRPSFSVSNHYFASKN